jgi:hypothetical protein
MVLLVDQAVVLQLQAALLAPELRTKVLQAVMIHLIPPVAVVAVLVN